MKRTFLTPAWLIWLLSAAVLTLSVRNPLYLLIILLSARTVQAACGRDEAKIQLSFWRFAAVVITFSVLFNVLLVHVGETIIFELPRSLPLVGGPLTVEAAVFGLISALILITLLAVFLAFNSLAPTSDLIALAPRALSNVGIVVLIAVSYVPETLRQLERIREAQALRGHQVSGLRDWQPILIPLLVGSLERSMSLAETMVARGYGATSGKSLRPIMRIMLLSGLVLLFGGWILSFQQQTMAWVSMVAGGLLLLLTYYLQGRHVQRTRYQVNVWKLDDLLLVVVSLLPLALVLLPLPGTDNTSLFFTPYPSLNIPPFDPVLGFGLMMLAVPAILVEI